MLVQREAKKKARNRERVALRRAMESEVERRQRLDASRKYSAEKRAKESAERKAERRMIDRRRAAERRARESQWEREQRLALGRLRAAERRAMESDETREIRLAQNRERLATKRALKANKVHSDVANGAICQSSVARLQALPIFTCSASWVGQTWLEAESAPEAIPVVEAMATNSGQQQDHVPAAAGSHGGEVKGTEVKQEIVEIKEFRAGIIIF